MGELEEIMAAGIYCIENMLDGKRYIGKASYLQQRLNHHKSMLRNPVYNKNENRHLWYAVQKYGFENFHFGVIETHPNIDSIRLAERELYWQDWYTAHNHEYGYNMLRESAGVVKHSEETKRNASERQKGKPVHPNCLAASIKATKGVPKTLAHRKAMSESKRGKPMHPTCRAALLLANKGKTISEDHKAAISKAQKGVPKTPEHCENMSKANIGKKHTDEHIQKANDNKRKYSFEQYSFDGALIATYRTIQDVIAAGFSESGVRDACVGGRKKSCRGFIWKTIPFVNNLDTNLKLC